jgi:flagellar basal body-associated protein FliL
MEAKMRAILLIMILAVVGLIAAIATGFINISQTREARAPAIEAANGTIRAQAGQSPAFAVQTGSVEVGTREANVAVPKIEVKRDKAKVDVPHVEVRPAEEAKGNAN